MSNPYEIDIEVETSYMADHSEPDKDRYVFAYTITLVNRGSISAKLLTRRWIITDADNRIEEVEGESIHAQKLRELELEGQLNTEEIKIAKANLAALDSNGDNAEDQAE